jgi:hypothetical protein
MQSPPLTLKINLRYMKLRKDSHTSRTGENV